MLTTALYSAYLNKQNRISLIVVSAEVVLLSAMSRKLHKYNTYAKLNVYNHALIECYSINQSYTYRSHMAPQSQVL